LNFYDFHIGDYASRTGHLEPMEDLAYRRMLDLYYVRELPLPENLDEVAKLIRLREHADLIRSVLGEFFHLTDRGWEHDKCEEVIAAAEEKRSKAQASAVQRWHSGRNANALPTQMDGNAPSPSPIPIPKKTEGAVALLMSRGIPQDLATDFNAIRKAKRCPLTASALQGIEQEAEKAGLSLDKALRECCQRGWAGFKASWLDGRHATTSTVPGPTERDPALVKIEADSMKAAKPAPEVKARMDAILKGKVYQ
jgi:uncharacterized protein YdaU (DUF1376 family)